MLLHLQVIDSIDWRSREEKISNTILQEKESISVLYIKTASVIVFTLSNNWNKHIELNRSKTIIFCDNWELVNYTKNDPHAYHRKYHMSEREVVYAIIPPLPDRINAIYLHIYQDKVKRRNISTLPEQPNDLAEDS